MVRRTPIFGSENGNSIKKRLFPFLHNWCLFGLALNLSAAGYLEIRILSQYYGVQEHIGSIREPPSQDFLLK